MAEERNTEDLRLPKVDLMILGGYMNKVYLIVLDGGGDRPIARLDNRTPFEAAVTPTLDQLALKGSQALISIVDNDIAAESDSGCMALLSYDPLIYYKGRGPLEAWGAGMLREDWFCAAFRVNFASYSQGQLERRTARGLNNDELQALTGTINQKLDLTDYYNTTFKLISYRNHRGIVTFYNETIPLSGNVSYTDPGFERNGYFGINITGYIPIPLSCEPLDRSPATMHTAHIINLFVERAFPILDTHEVNEKRREENKLAANFFLIRDGGDVPCAMPSFYSKFDRTLSVYGQLSAEKTVAELIGAKFTYSRQKESEGDIPFFANLIDEMMSDDADIIFAHMKGPDEPGHDDQPLEKIRSIESLDRNFLAPLVEKCDLSDILIVTCDHATPCELRLHSSDLVPVVVYGPDIKMDSTSRFGESYAAKGGLGVSRATDLLDCILNGKGG